MIAKKKFGQNFLKDESVVDKIIQSMSCKKEHKLVEIGPGLGDLTQELLKKFDVIAYEIDRDLVKILNDKFLDNIKNKQLKLHEIDVLKACKKGSLSPNKYDLIGNLPYNIASKIILLCLDDENCESLTVMVQKEVAIRFLANENEKNYSPLSILTQSVSQRYHVIDVGKECFNPSPKVNSAVIQLRKFDNLRNYRVLEKYLKIAFASPRKTLMKNLSIFYEKNTLEDEFLKLGLDNKARPHEVNIKNHTHLSNTLSKVKNDKKDKFQSSSRKKR